MSLAFPSLFDSADNKNNDNLATHMVRNDKSLSDFQSDFLLFENTPLDASHFLAPAPLLHDHDANNTFNLETFIDLADDSTFGTESFDLQTVSGSAVFSCDGAGLAA